MNSLVPDLFGSEGLLLTVHETPQIRCNRASGSRWGHIWGVGNTFCVSSDGENSMTWRWYGAGMQDSWGTEAPGVSGNCG